MRTFWSIVLISLLAVILTACAGGNSGQAEPTATAAAQTEATSQPAATGEGGGQATLTVMTHDSFSVSEEVVAAFEEQYNAIVSFVPSGDAGSALNRAILSKDAPIADVFYGVDNTFLSRALEAGIFLPYEALALAEIPAEFRLDPQNGAIPVDYGDVCINYDKAFFAEQGLAVPQSLEDLTKPEYRDMLVIQNPATSSPGLAFLLASIAQYGPDSYLDFWAKLRDNGVVVVNDWETAYYGSFSASSGRGPQPMVVSYASSPAAEVIYAETPLDDSPTASILSPGTCFRQIEFVGILQGTQNEELAQAWVDFMLSPTFQEDVPLQMFVYPVLPSAQLPEEFQQYAQVAQQPAAVPAEEIAQNREQWITDWTETVLQ